MVALTTSDRIVDHNSTTPMTVLFPFGRVQSAIIARGRLPMAESAVVLLGSVALAVSASAQSILVTNDSFESPTVPIGVPAWPQVDNWQKNPQPASFNPDDFGGITWDQLSAGVFPNPSMGEAGYIDNITGSQAGYVWSFPGAGISQELSATYQPGLAYRLTVGAFANSDLRQLPDGSFFSISLYYLDAGSSMTIAMEPVTYTAAFFSQADHFYDFTLTTDVVQSGDPWAGQNVGIALSAQSISGQGFGFWDVDNVRLTAVPEPSGIGLLVLGLGMGVWLFRQRTAARL